MTPCRCRPDCPRVAARGRRGLSWTCYTRHWRNGTLETVAAPRRIRVAASAAGRSPRHPCKCGGKVHSNDKCRRCYDKWRWMTITRARIRARKGAVLERPDADEPDEAEAAEVRGRIEEMRRAKARAG